MALRLRNNCEFLHIPKTGGTWVESVLKANDLIINRLGNKHSDFDRTIFNERLGTGRELLRFTAGLAFKKILRTKQNKTKQNKNISFLFCSPSR